MARHLYIPILLLAVFVSCTKPKKDDGSSVFYGSWKASYGDTLVFFNGIGKNILRYDLTMNPAMPMRVEQEYAYRNGKLGVKTGLTGLADYRFFQTFRWINPGTEFEIQGVDWFPFLSSTSTYFTYKKLP